MSSCIQGAPSSEVPSSWHFWQMRQNGGQVTGRLTRGVGGGPPPCLCFPASRSSERPEWMQGWQLQPLPPIRLHRKKSAIRDPYPLPPVSTSQTPGLAALPSGCQASRGSLALGGETRGTPAGVSFCPVTDQHRGQDRKMGFERGGGLVSATLSFWKLTKIPQNSTRGLPRRAGEGGEKRRRQRSVQAS